MSKNFGGILKKSIDDHNMTQKQVADIVNISQQTLSGYIHNRRMPDLECFFNLVELLDLNEQFFNDITKDTDTIEHYLKITIPKLDNEQKRVLFFVTLYMDKLNQLQK